MIEKSIIFVNYVMIAKCTGSLIEGWPLHEGQTLPKRGLVIRFGYQKVNANLFTSAVDVYQVTFSIFGVYYVTFYT